jgi:hypothetical protein
MSVSISCKPQQIIMPSSARTNVYRIQYRNLNADLICIFQEAEPITGCIFFYILLMFCAVRRNLNYPETLQ